MEKSVKPPMAEDEKKRVLAYNKMRESYCWLEGKNESTWLRPERRHYPQSNRTSLEKFIEEKHEYDSGRTTWIKITPPDHKEKRHFPEKVTDHAIFG
ncbi:spermatogenesis-associated protein 45 [Sceloporus undulatus]|uniref:spermatogenesis-associated protein 45 n=1 Tax=Sceloporus undulatus TaxID=8520 RepID=UPI001C4BDDC2|nr:spermatogenesis-associated protein 45 [Sceloporus undulatus]